jgi:hypothetical protein
VSVARGSWLVASVRVLFFVRARGAAEPGHCCFVSADCASEIVVSCSITITINHHLTLLCHQ